MRKFLLVVLIIFAVGVMAFWGYKAIFSKRPFSQRQAVFMNNGQVYFGQISDITNQFIKLSNVYYLKTSELQSNDPNRKIILVKMGNELHGPEDIMYINRDQVLFYQNIKDSSKITLAIQGFIQKQIESSTVDVPSEIPK